MIMLAVVFCIAGWEELQTATYKFRGKIIVLNTQKSKTIYCARLGIFLRDRLQHIQLWSKQLKCYTGAGIKTHKTNTPETNC